MNIFKHIWLWMTIRRSGYKKDKHDDRDFDAGIFGWFEYKPKHTDHVIKTLSIKNQINRNTCVFESAIVAKEVDEGCVLSVRSIVAFANKMGWIKGNGFSSLKWGQEVLIKFGALKDGDMTEEFKTWKDWINVDIDNIKLLAAQQKTKSYWKVSNRSDILRLLDEGKCLTTATKWYTGFNQSGGFRVPWIIERIIGLLVGAHAYVIKGYKLNYHGRMVYICQNSYGKWWGNKGDFYVEMNWLDRNKYGIFVNLDIPKETGKIIFKYNLQNVKAPNNSSVYFIQRGKKLPYPNWLTYLSFNGKDKKIYILSQSEINDIPVGDVMDIESSKHWTFLKDVRSDKQQDKLLEILMTK